MDDQPFATIYQLKERWPDLPPADEELAKTMLADASTIIQASLPADHTVSSQMLTLVVCQMVRRALATSSVPEGVTSVSQTVGPFNTQMGFSSSSNNLYLTRAEKKLLGIGQQRASTVDLLAGGHK